MEISEVKKEKSHIIVEIIQYKPNVVLSKIDDKKSKTIDKIKTLIIDLVQNKNN